jgi:hypothetical protein
MRKKSFLCAMLISETFAAAEEHQTQSVTQREKWLISPYNYYYHDVIFLVVFAFYFSILSHSLTVDFSMS